jgi:hypothetical protein
MTQLRCFSYGGGVQSTAALVLAAQGKIDFKIFLFSNVGDDSEHPDTLRYVEEVAKPYAAAQGIELMELRKIKRDGSVETVYGRIMKPGGRSQVIPVFLDKSGMPGNRSCTSNFKIDVLAKELKRRGATAEAPAITGLGISLDEFQRIRTDSGIAWQVLEYPLIELRLTRQDCMNIISRAGLPVPRKSSCFFCPYHRITEWQRMKREEPELFQKAVEVERKLNDFAATRGDAVWLTRKLRPLDQVIGDQSDMFDDVDDACESGFCMV